MSLEIIATTPHRPGHGKGAPAATEFRSNLSPAGIPAPLEHTFIDGQHVFTARSVLSHDRFFAVFGTLRNSVNDRAATAGIPPVDGIPVALQIEMFGVLSGSRTQTKLAAPFSLQELRYVFDRTEARPKQIVIRTKPFTLRYGPDTCSFETPHNLDMEAALFATHTASLGGRPEQFREAFAPAFAQGGAGGRPALSLAAGPG